MRTCTNMGYHLYSASFHCLIPFFLPTSLFCGLLKVFDALLTSFSPSSLSSSPSLLSFHNLSSPLLPSALLSPHLLPTSSLLPPLAVFITETRPQHGCSHSFLQTEIPHHTLTHIQSRQDTILTPATYRACIQPQ